MTIHFFANDVIMCFHFALAMKEITEVGGARVLLPGGCPEKRSGYLSEDWVANSLFASRVHSPPSRTSPRFFAFRHFRNFSPASPASWLPDCFCLL